MLASFVFVHGVASGASNLSNLSEQYPAGSIRSVETADRALEEVDRARTVIEAQYVEEERGCYPKFFTTSCLQNAKERRRRELARLKPIEVDANSFKRHAKVAERDAALSQKQERKEDEILQRGKETSDADAAASMTDEEAEDAKSLEKKEKANQESAAKRVADRQAKLKRQEAQDAADAQKRADNIQAYEKKVRESEARQREIEAKKSGK